MRRASAPLAALVLGAGLSQPASAQDSVAVPTLHDPTRPMTQVMVLGVFHFHNPNADYAQFEGIDVLTPQHQREIGAIADGLVAFAPTKIAVEKVPSEADSINARYRRYREGSYELSRNEVDQLGLRLARRLNHERLYAVDYRLGLRIDSVLAYAAAHDPTYVEKMQRYIGEIEQLFNRMQRDETIATNLRFLNRPDNMAPAHSPYVVQATIGAGDGYIGARVVADWYKRNLYIFANLARVADPGDRILLIVGAGHAPILRELVRAHPDMELVEAVDYLP